MRRAASFATAAVALAWPHGVARAQPGADAAGPVGYDVAVEGAPSAAPPRDEPPPSFGERGQFVVSGDTTVAAYASSYDGSSASTTSYVFAPAVDYFFARNFSIGLLADVAFSDQKGYGADSSLVDTRTTTLQAGPRFGFNVPLGPAFSWYPQAVVGFEWIKVTEQTSGGSLSVTENALGYPSTTQLGPYVSLYAPLLLHPTNHFFIGFGPTLFRDFGSVSGGPIAGGQRTEIGTEIDIGAYWGGEPSPRTGSPQPSKPPRRFGEAGEFVFTNDLNLSLSSLTYDGTGSMSQSLQMGGSFDYFLVDHLSLGVAIGGSLSHSRGVDASNGATVVESTGFFECSPRIGVDFPVGGPFSVHPLLGLEFGHETYDEVQGASENKATQDILALNLFVPLLLHPAPHAFVGFGPRLYRELSHAVHYPDDPNAPPYQNQETTVEAEFVVGGWL